MARIYTTRFFKATATYPDGISWTCPDDGNTYVLRDVWWFATGISIAESTVYLSIADISVWGAQPQDQLAFVGSYWWFWQGRQVVEAGETVTVNPSGAELAEIGAIATGYVLTPP